LAAIIPKGIKDAKGNHTGTVGVISEITERKRIEEELRQRKEELSTVLDAIPAMVWIGLDPEYRFITGNRLVNELFGAPFETNLSQTTAQKGQAQVTRSLWPPMEEKPWNLSVQKRRNISGGSGSSHAGDVRQRLSDETGKDRPISQSAYSQWLCSGI
jgi:PAS domain-containing protein